MEPNRPDLGEHLVVIRRQLAAIQEQLAAMSERHKQLCALVAQLRPRPAEGDRPAEADPAVPGQLVLAACARDIQSVLQEAGHPLTMLEILEALVHRQLPWRESTVSHALADLSDHGLVKGSGDSGPFRYGLAAGR